VIALDLDARNASQAAAVVRALGQHRYVAGSAHLVHALAFDAVADAPFDELAEAVEWARTTLADPSIDASSRDERLHRRSTEAELAAVLSVFWSTGSVADAARRKLRASLELLDLPLPAGAPFDPEGEDEIHPLLIDAGWELLPLHSLDPERHKGAINAFGERILYDAAAFEEETAIPPFVPLHELAAMGPNELLSALDADGALVEPLTLWVEGNATYHEYVLRGVKKVAKIDL
jgi:hypothetical protein